MKKTFALTLVALTVLAAIPAFADLQNVVVGGSIRIRGNYYTSPAGPDSWTARNPIFQGPWVYSFRPLGNPLAGVRWLPQPGRLGVGSWVDWDDSGSSLKNVEQRTKLNVRADFTDQVSAFIELDSYDVWGEDFRSNYLTGVDNRAWSGDDVEVYQAYIEADEMFGYPVRLRVGRQELKFGSGWLVAPQDTAAVFTGTSFDAIRATYATDLFSVDAFWSKLAERGTVEEDGDVDFYGVYASYLGFEGVMIDAYWFFLRDALALGDTYPGWIGDWVEDVLGVDDYDPTTLHTVGLRGSGTIGAFDFEAEAAYQFGNADAVNATFAGAGVQSPYGPDGEDLNNWAANLEVGYTFDMAWTPRVYLGGAYFGGEDKRDVNFWDWVGAMVCPFWSAESSVSFNRLFSSWEYSEFLENSDLSNVWIGRGGVSVNPTEKIKLLLAVTYFECLEPYDISWPSYFLLGSRVNWLYQYSFIDQENDDDLGWEVGLYATYKYSDNLTFDVGYARLFVGDGASEGNFVNANGLAFNGGTSDDDADYVFFETKLAF